MGKNNIHYVLLLCLGIIATSESMRLQKQKSSPHIQRLQGSPREEPSPRQTKSRFPTLACLAARCLAHETDLLKGDAIDLITPKDQTCVRDVILRELIKPHIFPLTIADSQNRESVHHNGVCGLDFIPSTNEVVSGACDGKVVFCNRNSLAAGTAYVTDIPISTLCIPTAFPLEIFLGADGNVGKIYRLNYETKKIDSAFIAHDGAVSKICVGDALIASCSIDKTVKVWNKKTAAPIAVFKDFKQAVRCLELTEDETVLISGSSDGKIKLWNVPSATLIKEYSEPKSSRIWGLGTMKNGKRIVAGLNSGRIVLLDATRLQEICQWYGHGSTITGLSCDSDEKYFVTGSWDSKARLWDVRMRVCAATFLGHTDWVTQVKCLGNEVVTGAKDNMLRLWDIRKIKAIDTQELSKITALAQRLKKVPLLKEPQERMALVDGLTKTP